MNKTKQNIIMVALVSSTLTGCTGNYKCTDTFSQSTCMSIFNGISSGMEKHNERMSEYREAREMEKFYKRMER